MLQNGAILIANAHKNDKGKGFWEFLRTLKRNGITTSQLILMEDIFDLLINEISAAREFARPYIKLLEKLALKMKIIYLEGNHDFNLVRFFQRVKIFNLQKQPLRLNLHTSKNKDTDFRNSFITLAHGDIFLSPPLQFALKSLRNHYLLVSLNFLSQISFSSISNKILKNQNKKNFFCRIENFKNLTKERYKKCENLGFWVCEGHYHQSLVLDEEDVKYFNSTNFAYERSFFIVECYQETRFREQRLRSQNV